MTTPRRLSVDWNSTPLHGEEFRERLSLTYEGQAHFALTGPAGAHCRSCAHWGEGWGKALSRPCRKFSAMTGVTTKLVPGTALACRHFEKRKEQ
jgi:hypothetical protein